MEAVAGDPDDAEFDVVDVVTGLIAKSLLSPLGGRPPQRYRLLDTTRTYALEQLARTGHKSEFALRHASYLTSMLLKNAENDEPDISSSFLEVLSDVRSALVWCFSDHGDKAAGVALAAASATPFLEHSLFGECYRWSERAIARLDEAERGSDTELELQTSLGWSAMFAPGKADAMHSAFLRGLDIVDQHPNPHQELRLLGGLSIVLTRACDYTGALELAERGAAIARTTSDKAAIARADWDLGVCHHLCGHHSIVEKYCDSALNPLVHSSHIRKITDHGYDHRGRALIARARSLWLLGYPDRAVGAARFAISAAEELGHPVSLCITLVYSSTVLIWANEWSAAEAAVERLLATSRDHSLMYGNVGIALREISNVRRTADIAALDKLHRVLNDLRRDRHTILLPMCQTTIAETLLEASRAEEARSVIDLLSTTLVDRVERRRTGDPQGQGCRYGGSGQHGARGEFHPARDRACPGAISAVLGVARDDVAGARESRARRDGSGCPRRPGPREVYRRVRHRRSQGCSGDPQERPLSLSQRTNDARQAEAVSEHLTANNLVLGDSQDDRELALENPSRLLQAKGYIADDDRPALAAENLIDVAPDRIGQLAQIAEEPRGGRSAGPSAHPRQCVVVTLDLEADPAAERGREFGRIGPGSDPGQKGFSQSNVSVSVQVALQPGGAVREDRPGRPPPGCESAEATFEDDRLGSVGRPGVHTPGP
jgi:hypothetical protein